MLKFDILRQIHMTNARQKILNYIIEQQSATADELSKVFRVTPANIRHHLSILLGQGSLKIIGQRTKPGKGRPTLIYSAAQQRDRNNLGQLADTLLSTLINSSKAGESESILREVARQMVNQYPMDKFNPTRRMYSSIRALNRMSYQAHWEAHIDHPRIMLGHCPYRSTLDHHPELCQLDSYILQELLDTPVRQIEKQVFNDKGIAECIFLLGRQAG
jgi:predicted ArsR family transcriptional regulator